MSASIVETNTPVALIKDPILDLNKRPKFAVLQGGKTVAWQEFQANSIASNQIQITCNPPSRDTGVAQRSAPLLCRVSSRGYPPGLPGPNS